MKKLALILLVLVVGGCMGGETSEQYETRMRSAALNTHPEWSERIKEWILGEQICKGMTPEQIEAAWVMSLECEYMGSSGRAKYVGYQSDSDGDGLLRAGAYEQRYYGNLSGTYTFWFKDGKLEDWSWSPHCYMNYGY